MRATAAPKTRLSGKTAPLPAHPQESPPPDWTGHEPRPRTPATNPGHEPRPRTPATNPGHEPRPKLDSPKLDRQRTGTKLDTRNWTGHEIGQRKWTTKMDNENGQRKWTGHEPPEPRPKLDRPRTGRPRTGNEPPKMDRQRPSGTKLDRPLPQDWTGKSPRLDRPRSDDWTGRLDRLKGTGQKVLPGGCGGQTRRGRKGRQRAKVGLSQSNSRRFGPTCFAGLGLP